MPNQNEFPDAAGNDSGTPAGYTAATITFLRELPEHTQPSDEAWHKKNKARFRRVLRDPTRNLVDQISDRYIYCKSRKVAGRANKVSRVRKNFNKGFCDHYWFAFYDPKAGGKRRSPQLYFYLDGESRQWHYGFSLSESPPKYLKRFVKAIQDNFDVVRLHLSKAPEHTWWSAQKWAGMVGKDVAEPPGGDDEDAGFSVYRVFPLETLVKHDATLVDEVGGFFEWAWPFFFAGMTGKWRNENPGYTQLAEEVSAPQRFREGATRIIAVNAYERNPVARQKCIDHYGRICAVCDHCMADYYGSIAEGLIHVHHLRELAKIGEQYDVDPIKDLRPVCPNCHAVLHITRPVMSIEALRKSLDAHQQKERPAKN